jgi:sphingolipid delta-4 desaturase
MSNEATAWHTQRRREILRAHPEVKALYGPHRSTALWVVALTFANATLQIACATRPWWQVIALAWVVGAILVHGQFMLIHELGHSLVFRRLWANNLFALIANLTLGAPGGIAFRRQHALHHQHLGEGRAIEGRDTQSPTYDEAVRVGHAWYRKVPHFVFGRFYFKPRPASAVPTSAWTVANAVLSIGWVVLVVALFGPKPLVYGVVSMIASVGPHPLGGRRLSEHLTWRRSQPRVPPGPPRRAPRLPQHPLAQPAEAPRARARVLPRPLQRPVVEQPVALLPLRSALRGDPLPRPVRRVARGAPRRGTRAAKNGLIGVP